MKIHVVIRGHEFRWYPQLNKVNTLSANEAALFASDHVNDVATMLIIIKLLSLACKLTCGKDGHRDLGISKRKLAMLALGNGARNVELPIP